MLPAQPLPLFVSPVPPDTCTHAMAPRAASSHALALTWIHNGKAKGGIGLHRAKAESACSSDRRSEAASALLAHSFSASAAARSRSRRPPALNCISSSMIRPSAVRPRPSLCSSCSSRRRDSRSKRAAIALAFFSAHAVCRAPSRFASRRLRSKVSRSVSHDSRSCRCFFSCSRNLRNSEAAASVFFNNS